MRVGVCVFECACVCVCFGARACVRTATHGAPVCPRRNVRTAFVGLDCAWFGSQVFNLATAFNANIASWNVQSVTSHANAFTSVGLADCIKRGVYDAWGSTLRTAYPTWSSLSAVCATPTPTATPRYPILLGPLRHGRATAALGCSHE